MPRLALPIAALAALTAASGCDDTCRPGVDTTRCAGLELQVCTGREGYWEDEHLCGTPCPDGVCPLGASPVSACVTNARGVGFCPLSSAPVPACSGGAATACWGNDIVSCDATGYVASRVQSCGALHCIDADGGPFCALTDEPVPGCAHQVSTGCWQNQVVACAPSGHALSSLESCGDRQCVDTPGCGPLCVIDPQPNPQCTPGTASVCVGGVPTDCQCGYGIATHAPCAEADFCQTALVPMSWDAGADAGDSALWIGGESGAFCALAAQRNPNCRPGRLDVVCEGQTLVECNDGWELQRTDCPGECHAYGGSGFCG
jgi:hypothetical protein